MTERGEVDRRTAWRMVAIGFLASNCALGLTIGSFAPVLPALQAELGVNRATIASLLAIMYMSLGLASPFVGQALTRHSLRGTMIAGALLLALGFALLSIAGSFLTVVGIYGLLIGPGVCLLSIVPTTTLVNRWFVEGRGRALGFATMTLFLLFTPPLAARIVEEGGPKLLFLGLAAVFLLLIAPLTRIRDWPPGATSSGQDTAHSPVAGAWSIGRLLGNRSFWVLSLAMGVLTSSTGVLLTHAIPIAGEKGISPVAAATLVSMFGAGNLIGAPMFGALADRMGPLPALAINALCQAGLWLLVAWSMSLGGLLTAAALIGLCAGATIALHSAALTLLFGAETYSRAMGLSYFLKVPFLLAVAPAAGHVFDVTGSYSLAELSNAAMLGIAMVAFLALAPRRTPNCREAKRWRA